MEDISKVILKRIIHAPIDDVFDAWTTPSEMKKWYSPEGMSTTEATSESNKDGKYTVTMKVGETTFQMHGKYIEFDRPYKLVFTWESAMPKDDKPSIVSVEFKKISENITEVSLTHSGFGSKEDRDQHDVGWNGTINKLEKYIGN